MAPGAQRTVGILGAGRRRNGLGPFLARRCEESGLCVAGIAGRDPDRTALDAAELERICGHPVRVHGDAVALARSGIDALVVAAPPEAHVEGLAAALGAGIACLCEKPLAVPAALGAAADLVEAFAARGLLLVENVQWPYVLPAFDALFPGAPRPPGRVALGLSPSRPGPAMVLDSLPHLLSLCCTFAPVGPPVALAAAELRDHGAAAEQNLLRLRLEWDGGGLEGELHLRVCREPPRPAWLGLDGRRMDRRIGAGYAIAFAAGGREVPARDPLLCLVEQFAASLRAAGSGAVRDGAARAAATAAAARVARRLAWYGQALGALGLARRCER